MGANSKTITLVLAIILGSSYGFIRQSKGTDIPAIYKTSLVLGYDVTGIIFDLNEVDPTAIDMITFHIRPSRGPEKATLVMVQTEPGGVWTACSLVDDVPPARVATCQFESLAVDDVTALEIIAK